MMGVFSGFADVSALDLSAADAAPVTNVAVTIKAIVQSGIILPIFSITT